MIWPSLGKHSPFLFCLVASVVGLILSRPLIDLAESGGHSGFLLTALLFPFVHVDFAHWLENAVAGTFVYVYFVRVLPGLWWMWMLGLWGLHLIVVNIGYGFDHEQMGVGLSGWIACAVGAGVVVFLFRRSAVLREGGRLVPALFGVSACLYVVVIGIEIAELIGVAGGKSLQSYEPSIPEHGGCFAGGVFVALGLYGTSANEGLWHRLFRGAAMCAVPLLVLMLGYFRPWDPGWCLGYSDELSDDQRYSDARFWLDFARRIGAKEGPYQYRLAHLYADSGDYTKCYRVLDRMDDGLAWHVRSALALRKQHPRPLHGWAEDSHSNGIICNIPNWEGLSVGVRFDIPVLVVVDGKEYRLVGPCLVNEERRLVTLLDGESYLIDGDGYVFIERSAFGPLED